MKFCRLFQRHTVSLNVLKIFYWVQGLWHYSGTFRIFEYDKEMGVKWLANLVTWLWPPWALHVGHNLAGLNLTSRVFLQVLWFQNRHSGFLLKEIQLEKEPSKCLTKSKWNNINKCLSSNTSISFSTSKTFQLNNYSGFFPPPCIKIYLLFSTYLTFLFPMCNNWKRSGKSSTQFQEP